MSIRNDIAHAIRKADKSYFFEDYSKQATAVLSALSTKGYKLLPKELTEEMLKAGTEAIPNGKVHPEEVIKRVYAAMYRAATTNK